VNTYIGLMSGTSTDGVDGVVARFDGGGVDVRAHACRPFQSELREALLALNASGPDELHRAALAANALAGVYAEVVAELLAQSGLQRTAIRAIGAHGQTVRHRPGAFDGIGYTWQLNAPALLAERCGIDVIADFRSRDLAAGGQAAPLVPVFHRAVFGRAGADVAVLNLGGIANLSLLGADGSIAGFDTGPANVLMDRWIERHHGQAFDAGGAWAAQGRIDATLLAAALAEPFFSLAPPKSTGRDLFDAAWLDALLARHGQIAPVDVQATLCELSARSIADALLRHAPATRELLVCGGGAFNDTLLARLRAALPDIAVLSSAERGLPPLQVEATAFAWLAMAHVERRAGNDPAVTGARGPRVLGALYPA